MKYRILLVEDELVIALGIKKSLEKLGYDVIELAVTGEEAVEKALELHPDLILMDIILQGPMDGVQAARKICEKADIPILYLTANADSATVERARDTMPYGYMNKPINDRDMMSNIDTALHKHRMERRLRESEEKYRSLVENINDVIVSVDESGTVTYVSPRAYDVAGYRDEDVLGKNLLTFVHPDDREKVIKLFGLTRSGGYMPGKYRMISKTGSVIWVRTSGRPIFADGRFSGVRVIMSDITSHIKSENEITMKHEELAAANEELQAIIEELEATNEELRMTNMQFEAQSKDLDVARKELADKEVLLASISQFAPVGIGLVREGVIIWTNTMIHSMSGYSEQELKGQSMQIFYPGEDEYRSALDVMNDQLMMSGTATFKARCRRKNGMLFDVLISAAPLGQRDMKGSIIFTATEITEKKIARPH
jgi:PAS domain S-box-containing protein